MIILGICDNVTVLKVIKLVKTIITIIKIVVPIILILSCMIEAAKSITSNESDITSQLLKKWVAKVIAAILIFLIPTFVNIIASITDANGSEFSKCIQNSTAQGITGAETKQARKYINIAKTSLLQSDYVKANSVVNQVVDQNYRTLLQGELNVVKYYMELRNQIDELAQSYNSSKAKSLYTKINALQDEGVKAKLLGLLEEAGIGKPLNVASGMHLKTHDGVKYYEVIPEDATTRMPLIIYLVGGNPHGAFSGSSSSVANAVPTKHVINGTAYKYEKFIYIYPDYTANSPSSFKKIKDIIDHVVDEYAIDQEKIILTGVSNGAVATYWLAVNYPKFFSAVVPMCGPAYDYTPPKGYNVLPGYLDKASAYVGVSLWTMTAGRGDFGNYEYKSQQLVKKIHQISPSSKALYCSKVDDFVSIIKSELGKNPSVTPSISIYQHCTIMAYYGVPELWEWMIKQ